MKHFLIEKLPDLLRCIEAPSHIQFWAIKHNDDDDDDDDDDQDENKSMTFLVICR